MITPPDATADAMLKSLTYTLAALDAAADLDLDRNDADRGFFADEKANLEIAYEKLNGAKQALSEHILKESVRLQARVMVGDAVLDRGVRTAKARMKLELRNAKADAADFVFGSNIVDLVDAELRKEPALVLQAVARFEHVPDFPGKDEMARDLTARAEQQEQSLDARDQGEMIRSKLASTQVRAIADASDALYRLEKRLLERFTRERDYVRDFFLDAAPARKPKAAPAKPE